MLRTLAVLFALMVAMPLSANQVHVVVSFSILEDWVQEVGGSHVEVTTLVGRDSDSHAYRPTPSDAKKVASADLLIINGLGFEGWMPRLIDAAGYRGELLVASTGVKTLQSNQADHDHDHDEGDPHAWHSFANVVKYVRNIERGLTAIDPQNSRDYSANAERYIEQLNKLHTKYAAAFAAVPTDARKVVTSHNAFMYLADEYNIELLTPQPSTTGVGSSAQRIAQLIERIRDHNIRALFLENVVDPRLLEQVSEETGVAIGGRLYSDALSTGNGEAPTYLLMMQHNLEAILKALTLDV